MVGGPPGVFPPRAPVARDCRSAVRPLVTEPREVMPAPASASPPIVVIDSGLGGLTVARAIRHKLPAQDILYSGDTARLPYGTKTAATVTTFVTQIIRYLRPRNPRHVVIACNTATAL